MKNVIMLSAMGLLVAGCASNPPNKVPTFNEAVSQNSGQLPLGTSVVNNPAGENLLVTVENLRAKLEEANRTIYERNREIEYLKSKTAQLQEEANILRVRSNLRLENEVKKEAQVKTWDAQSNPVYEKSERNPASTQ